MKNIKIEKIVLYTAVNRNHTDSALDVIIETLDEQYEVQILDYENPLEYDVKRKQKGKK
tara:strand:+ start:314 stop:490 length:177 start_codon:yes stop_codon:yes gene_type:complete